MAVLALGGLTAGTAQAAGPEANVEEWACDHVTVKYSGFENLPGYIATIKVTVDGTTISYTHHEFTGPEATITVTIAVPPGHHSIDVFSKWKGNNTKGGHDQPLKGGITCEADPDYEIVKKQRRGGKGAYSTETIPNGKVGQVVEYGIVVKNTGNVPLKFSNFSDPNCDEGTITGGPGETAVPPGGFSNFFCKHTLTEADHVAGSYCNIASVTGSPPEGEGDPKSKESNEVCVELPTPKNKVEFTCKGITFYFEGFPNMPNNTVKMRIRVDGVYTPPKPEFQEYTFNGPTGSYTFPLNLSPGKHGVDGLAKWNTNGFKGGSDQTLRNGIICAAEPDFSIEKTQRVQGSEEPFTSEEVSYKAGETMEYQITITNTGNVGLKFPYFEDRFVEFIEKAPAKIDLTKCTETECSEFEGEPKCSGGPGATEVKPGASTQYTCVRTPDEEIEGEKVEGARNQSFAEAQPSEGPTFFHNSNFVFAKVE